MLGSSFEGLVLGSLLSFLSKRDRHNHYIMARQHQPTCIAIAIVLAVLRIYVMFVAAHPSGYHPRMMSSKMGKGYYSKKHSPKKMSHKSKGYFVYKGKGKGRNAPTPRPSTASPTITNSPTMTPSAEPSQTPTVSHEPSEFPSFSPSALPTIVPSESFTMIPSFVPSSTPTISHEPTPSPTESPTASPTITQRPSNTPQPTATPTTASPTAMPTATPYPTYECIPASELKYYSMSHKMKSKKSKSKMKSEHYYYNDDHWNDDHWRRLGSYNDGKQNAINQASKQTTTTPRLGSFSFSNVNKSKSMILNNSCACIPLFIRR